MLDFTAIDFETANSYRGSPCAVGLVKVRDGLPVDERRWLIRPPEEVDWFSPFNIALHAITPDMVVGAPRWRDILPSILEFIGGDAVVSHNAGFDIGVIRYACAVDNIDWPELRFLCTLVLARRALRLPSYRLPFVTVACGFDLDDHHDALADARAVVGIVSSLAHRAGVTALPDLAAAHGVRIGYMSSGIYTGSVCTLSSGGRLVRPETNPNADPDGYLYGRVVVFTGALLSMTRQIAWSEVAHAGGLPEPNTTKRTNILVLGDFNPATLRPGTTLSGRARKAFDLQDQGQDIELMTEADFLQVLDGNNPIGADLDAILAPNGRAPLRLPTIVTSRMPLGHLAHASFIPPNDPDQYWEWRGKLLAHPAGRAKGGEACVMCGEPIRANAHWIHRDRHVCGERCNMNLNRWLTRRLG